MTFEQMIPSKYLKKQDFPTPQIVTIAKFDNQNVAREDEPEDKKWVVYFAEHGDKGMVLNPTNIQLLKIAAGVDGPDQAIGKKVEVYEDPTVSYGGKITGGLRIRAPR